MISLVYVSAATQKFDTGDLQELLVVSRRNNAQVGVTGALAYVDGNFMQVLEGEAGDVDPLFDRISRDPRHRLVRMMVRLPLAERSFPSWNMEVVRGQFLRIEDRGNLRNICDGRLDASAEFSIAERLLEGFRESFFQSRS